MVDFHGFELPMWYSNIQQEHLETRNSAGIFDVSHMGLFRFKGANVRSWLSRVSTQDLTKFNPGRCGYTHFLDHNGHIIDDMIFSIRSEDEVLGVPNAYIIDQMFDWLESNLPEDGSITLENLTEGTSIIALQGPLSMKVVERVLGIENSVGRFRCRDISENNLGIEGWVQGTGYTGEEGVEFFIPDNQAEILWRSLLSDSEIHVAPVGLGARDTLRLEKGYLLSGQDFKWPKIGTDYQNLPSGFLKRNTAETRVPFGLDMNHNFIGREQTESMIGSEIKWMGLLCEERGPSPRTGHKVFSGPEDDSEICGFVTSGAPSPSLEKVAIAMAYLSNCNVGESAWIQTSSRRRVRAKICNPPFV